MVADGLPDRLARRTVAGIIGSGTRRGLPKSGGTRSNGRPLTGAANFRPTVAAFDGGESGGAACRNPAANPCPLTLAGIADRRRGVPAFDGGGVRFRRDGLPDRQAARLGFSVRVFAGRLAR